MKHGNNLKKIDKLNVITSVGVGGTELLTLFWCAISLSVIYTERGLKEIQQQTKRTTSFDDTEETGD